MPSVTQLGDLDVRYLCLLLEPVADTLTITLRSGPAPISGREKAPIWRTTEEELVPLDCLHDVPVKYEIKLSGIRGHGTRQGASSCGDAFALHLALRLRLAAAHRCAHWMPLDTLLPLICVPPDSLEQNLRRIQPQFLHFAFEMRDRPPWTPSEIAARHVRISIVLKL
jgi:hypothetical protein